MDIKYCSLEDLKAELKRREDEKKKAPTPLSDPDFLTLQNYIIDCVRTASKEGDLSKDLEHYVFEAAMEAVYGPNIWKWWNANADF